MNGQTLQQCQLLHDFRQEQEIPPPVCPRCEWEDVEVEGELCEKCRQMREEEQNEYINDITAFATKCFHLLSWARQCEMEAEAKRLGVYNTILHQLVKT